MPCIVIAADARWVVDEVQAALSGPDTDVIEIGHGAAVLPWAKENVADLVILDLQIGNMGGMAVCQELRLEETAGRLERVPVLMLLDRRADVHLARRVDAEGWLIKPLDPIRLRRAIRILLDGGTYYDASYAPTPIMVEGAPTPATAADAGPTAAAAARLAAQTDGG
ncbi:MAG TPA: response regulator [Acidimicrobiales bacterium]|nr:response regulator [Acidimicrobiales bacterium]